MASDARALLDEQIAALNELRDVAQWAFIGTAALPAMARRGDTDAVASYLARLVVEGRANLDDCLDRAQHWLAPTTPVYVPIPTAEGEYPSACAGAAMLLFTLAVLCNVESGSDDHELSTDADALAAELAEKWRGSGIPDWLSSAPVDDLTQLADVVKAETDTAIERVTTRFQAAAPAKPPDLSECHVTLLQMASIVNKSKRTLEKLRDDGKLPAPAVKGGKGKADEWRWSKVRPILVKKYKRPLPDEFPSVRFIRR